MRIPFVKSSLLLVLALMLIATPAQAQVASTDVATSPPSDDGSPTAPPDTFSASLIPDDVPTPKHTGVRALFRNLGNDFKALPSMPNLWIAGVGGAAALAVHPWDDSVNQSLQGTDFFNAGQYLGSTGIQIGGALGTYAIGRLTHSPKASHVGMDLLRAQLVAQALTQTIKVTVRRERPDGTKYSFPSGHTSVSVATAIVIDRHFGLAWSLPLYGMATYVSLSRMHDNRHWLSDVVFGAAVGAIAGRTVTRHGRSNYTWAPVYTPGEGVALLIMRDFKHQ